LKGILATFILLSNLSYAQNLPVDSLVRGDIELGYVTKSTPYDYRLLQHKFEKNKKQLCFFDYFNDSVSVYLNDNLITSKWFKPDTISKLSVVMLTVNNNRFNYVKIVMHKANEYIEFPLDKRYRFVELFFRRKDTDDNGVWNVNFTNNVPHRD
jgi:hypothetical protein